jgi:hypothetical protein
MLMLCRMMACMGAMVPAGGGEIFPKTQILRLQGTFLVETMAVPGGIVPNRVDAIQGEGVDNMSPKPGVHRWCGW